MACLYKLIVVGAGGMGSEAVWAAEAVNSHYRKSFEILGFCDDDSERKGQTFYGYPVLGTPEEVDRSLPEKPAFLCAIGHNKRRADMVARLLALQWEPVQIVHPSVTIAKNAQVGPGTYIGPGSIVSIDTRIGSHVIVNLGCTIGHNARLEDFSQISPGACVSGWASVKHGAFLGSNAVVAPRIKVGAWSTLGASSFAITNIPDGTTAVGNPAQVIFRAAEKV